MGKPISTQKPKFHFAWILLVGMCGIMVGTMGTVSSCMGTFTPSVAADLNVPVTAVALYFTIRTLTMAVFQPVAGILFNKMDVRVITAIAVVLSNGGMMCLSFCHHIWNWYIVAVVNGMGLAVICYMLVPVILNNWFHKHLSTAIGVSLAFTGIGGAILSPLAGQWIASVGFRTAYIYVGGIGFIISIICAVFLLRTRPADMGLLPIGDYEDDKKEAEESAEALAEKEKIQQMGFTVKECFSKPIFICIYLITVCLYFAGAFMQDITNMCVSHGMEITTAAAATGVMMWGIVTGKIVLGLVNDHLGTIACMCTAVGIGIVTFALLYFAGTNFNMVRIGCFLFGFICAAMSTNPPYVIKRAWGNKSYSKLYGISCTIGTLTSAVGHPTYARVYDVNGNYDLIMIICIIFLVAALLLTFIAIERQHKMWDPEGILKKC